jgi:class 3 adenylate cyclase
LNANLTSALCFAFTFSETHNNVTVFFSDIVRFTDISQALSPVKFCTMLDRLYVAFDTQAKKHEVFKVETIGDAWVGVTNRTCFYSQSVTLLYLYIYTS